MQSQISNKFTDFFRAVEKSERWACIIITEYQHSVLDVIKNACIDADLRKYQDYVVFGDQFRFSSNTNMLKALAGIKDKSMNEYFTVRYENIDVDIT